MAAVALLALHYIWATYEYNGYKLVREGDSLLHIGFLLDLLA